MIGREEFAGFCMQLRRDVSGHANENQAHNSLLAGWCEMQAALRLASEGKRVSRILRAAGRRTPDLSAITGVVTQLVEVKYIRPPDKLAEYLFRWWEAQRDLAGEIPQGNLPHLKFEWAPLNRKELSIDEINLLDNFFNKALRHPALDDHLNNGRLNVVYRPSRKLPLSTMSLDAQATINESEREGVFEKLRSVLESARMQLDGYADVQKLVYLFLNLSPDIAFLWPTRFEDRLEELLDEFRLRGIEIVVERVSYL